MNTTAAVTTDPRSLFMFSADDEEWVIAHDAEDARDVYCAQIGSAPELGPHDPGANDCGTHASDWERLDDEKSLTLREECEESHRPGRACKVPECKEGVVRRTMTAAEWAKTMGRGYWGSANAY